MIELEQRLRSALADLAEEVPPSRDALAEQQRRLAKSRPVSRPLLAAAAAAVVFGIAVTPAAIPHITTKMEEPMSPN